MLPSLTGWVGGGSYLSEDGGLLELEVGIKNTDETAGYEVKDTFFHVCHRHGCGVHARGDNGVVVCDFGGVEVFLVLAQRLTAQRLNEGGIRYEAGEDCGAFWIDVIRQESGIDTRVGCHLLLVEALDELQGLVS